MGQWVLLATCDHDGVVGGYRTIKGLAEASQDAGAGRPRLSLAAVDAGDAEESLALHRKLAGVCDQFLGWPLEAEPPVMPAGPVGEHVVLRFRPPRQNGRLSEGGRERAGPHWSLVARFLEDAAALADDATDEEVEWDAEAMLAEASAKIPRPDSKGAQAKPTPHDPVMFTNAIEGGLEPNSSSPPTPTPPAVPTRRAGGAVAPVPAPAPAAASAPASASAVPVRQTLSPAAVNAAPPRAASPTATFNAPGSAAAPAAAPIVPASTPSPTPGPATTFTTMPTLTPDAAEVLDLPGADPSPDAILETVIRRDGGLVECPVRAPMCAGARLAVGRDRSVTLLAVAQAGLADLRPIGQAYRWLQENMTLIGMAVPQFALDPAQPPRLRLLVDQADITAGVLQPMLEGAHVTVHAYRKLRWGGKSGLLLDAA